MHTDARATRFKIESRWLFLFFRKETKMSQKKENKGQFKPGNTIGSETRFTAGHKLSCKYKSTYPDSLLNYFKTCDGFPTFERWAVENNIAVRSLSNWIADENKYPLFADAYAQAKAIQKDKLETLGLTRVYDANMVKFLLANNHDMSEKSEQKIDGETSTDITINIREVN